MEERITREELLERLFHDDYENLKGKKLRLTRVRVPGKSLDFAHVFTPSDGSVYENLALHIGVHEGEDHRGETIGIMRVTPWEAIVVATDVAVKAAHVEVGFMDRFSGALIITGGFSQVMTAVEEVVRFFRDELHFDVCEIHRRHGIDSFCCTITVESSAPVATTMILCSALVLNRSNKYAIVTTALQAQPLPPANTS